MALRPVPSASSLFPARSSKGKFGSTTPSTASTTTPSTPRFPSAKITITSIRLGNLTKVQSNLTSRKSCTTSFLSITSTISTRFSRRRARSNPIPRSRIRATSPASATSTISPAANSSKPESPSTSTTSNSLLTARFPTSSMSKPRAEITISTSAPGAPLAGSGESVSAVASLARHATISRSAADLDRISTTRSSRASQSHFSSDNNTLTSADLCLTAPQDANFPCTRYSTFTPAPLHDQYNTEVSAYAQDRWSITNRLLIEPGMRLDWDAIVHHAEIRSAPRWNLRPRQLGQHEAFRRHRPHLRIHANFPDRPPLRGCARRYVLLRQPELHQPSPDASPRPALSPPPSPPTRTRSTSPRFINWSVGLEKKLPGRDLPEGGISPAPRLARIRLRHTNNDISSGDFVLENSRDDRYNSFQITLRRNFREAYMR